MGTPKGIGKDRENEGEREEGEEKRRRKKERKKAGKLARRKASGKKQANTQPRKNTSKLIMPQGHRKIKWILGEMRFKCYTVWSELAHRQWLRAHEFSHWCCQQGQHRYSLGPAKQGESDIQQKSTYAERYPHPGN